MSVTAEYSRASSLYYYNDLSNVGQDALQAVEMSTQAGEIVRLVDACEALLHAHIVREKVNSQQNIPGPY